jgi:GNAT superfamily N-acetyltransferase
LVPEELDAVSESNNVVLRKLRASDIPAAAQLSAEAGWNQTEEDWRLLFDLAPEGCLAIEVEEVLAATATLLCYGRRLAWIGMVLTKMPYRGRGFARRLLNEALTLADRMGIETVKLDATDQGRPIYEKLGFRAEQAVERWSRPFFRESSKAENLPGPTSAQNWYVTDHRAAGVDRSQLLEKLAAHNPPISIGSSYLLTRPGRLTRYLGPCVADDPRSAHALIQGAVQQSAYEWSWDLLPENVHAVAIAQELSFAPNRRLLRMVRGKDLRAQEEAIYAIAGFELG